MITINKPKFCTRSVYESCVNSVKDDNLRNKFTEIIESIVNFSKDYDKKAQKEELFQLIPNNNDNSDFIIQSVTKEELKSLYSQHMVERNKPARKIYDDLLNQAPICPFCGFGQATTLDHYLPKSKFPCLSVLPLNLVPSCKDCNTGKGNKLVVLAEQQPMHPYYDHHYFNSEQWLFAKVEESEPVVIKYYVNPPQNWTDISKKRVKAHFDSFGLGKRFSVQAANELSSIVPRRFPSLLNEHAENEFKNNKNSWKTAMYQALSKSDWYCVEGCKE
ncbi:hypothetical protein [uncultured Gammaproteobacteria bacterium]|nr:hypothetical protein [uncultured Gammaproteobacteria bacterium]